jgi:hypothetical protein
MTCALYYVAQLAFGTIRTRMIGIRVLANVLVRSVLVVRWDRAVQL